MKILVILVIKLIITIPILKSYTQERNKDPEANAFWTLASQDTWLPGGEKETLPALVQSLPQTQKAAIDP